MIPDIIAASLSIVYRMSQRKIASGQSEKYIYDQMIVGILEALNFYAVY